MWCSHAASLWPAEKNINILIIWVAVWLQHRLFVTLPIFPLQQFICCLLATCILNDLLTDKQCHWPLHTDWCSLAPVLYKDLASESDQKVRRGLIFIGVRKAKSLVVHRLFSRGVVTLKKKQFALASAIHRPLFPPSALTTSAIFWQLAHTPASIFTHLRNCTSSLIGTIYALIILCLSPFFCCQENRPASNLPYRWVRGSVCVVVHIFARHDWVHPQCVRVAVQQTNKTLSLDKRRGFLKHLASIQGTLQFPVFNSQLYNWLHHTCCA